MKKGFMLAVTCKPAAGAEFVNTAAAPIPPHIRALRQQACTAVFATMSYCWGPTIQEVEVCGGEHSSVRLLSEGPNMRSFGRCCGVR